MRINAPSLKGRALRYLSQREHSRAELQRKLAPYLQDDDDVNALLNELEAKGFINPARVVESVIRQRASKLGAMRIRQTLQYKGIDAQAIADAIRALSGSEIERAHHIWLKKFGQPAATPAERSKQIRFLASRGFSAETIAKAMRAPDNQWLQDSAAEGGV
jgi:regulatory protein